jgi:hypothetical protein
MAVIWLRRRPLTTEAQAPAQVGPCGICGGPSELRQEFLKVHRLPLLIL